jgi:hypothetical protein
VCSVVCLAWRFDASPFNSAASVAQMCKWPFDSLREQLASMNDIVSRVLLPIFGDGGASHVNRPTSEYKPYVPQGSGRESFYDFAGKGPSTSVNIMAGPPPPAPAAIPVDVSDVFDEVIAYDAGATPEHKIKEFLEGSKNSPSWSSPFSFALRARA